MLSSYKVLFSHRIVNRCKSLLCTKFYSSDVIHDESQLDNVQNISASELDTKPQERPTKSSHLDFKSLAENRYIYPEFLPDPDYTKRNKIREKLERADMLKRRCNIDIPEFYVGSILAVTTSDPYAANKENRFVGICMKRSYQGLRASFTLRNMVDGQGVEIMYDLYNPTVQKIEVLRLEKRLDEDLTYLRDCDPKYSTFPFNMEPEYHPEGEPVPVNPIKLKLGPMRWNRRWHVRYMKGLEPFEDVLNKWQKKDMEFNYKPYEAFDLMKQYRRCIPEEDQQEIWEEVESFRAQFQARKREWKQKVLQRAPKKTSDRERHNA